MAKIKLWTKRELFLLKKTHERIKTARQRVEYPKELLKTRTRGACTQKACKLRITRWFNEKTLDLSGWTDEQIGYFAGIIDGEGCIYCSHQIYRKTPYVGLSVTTTDKPLADWLAKKLNRGRIYKHKQSAKAKPHWKQAWQFGINGTSDLLGVLRAIEPHLIIKRKKAQEAIKILERKLLDRNGKQETQKTPSACWHGFAFMEKPEALTRPYP